MDIIKQRLAHLKQKGFNPNFILDIGACIGEWGILAKEIFPQSSILMLEANPENKEQLNNTGIANKICLLGDEEKEVEYYALKKEYSQYNTGNSIFLENTKHFTGDNYKTIKMNMETLDNVLNSYSKDWIKTPNLIKLDVQGAELIILEGAKNSLKECEFILLETQLLEYNKNAPMFFDIVNYMNNIGYQTYDFLGWHYLPSGNLMQMDVLFVKKDSKFISKGFLE